MACPKVADGGGTFREWRLAVRNMQRERIPWPPTFTVLPEWNVNIIVSEYLLL
jgi:hypothetical protein